MNIALEGTREFVDGKMRRSYGDAFVRGNNGMFCLSPRCSLHFSGNLSPSFEVFDSATRVSLSSLLQRVHICSAWKWLTDTFNSDVHFRRLIEWLWHGKCTQIVSYA
jgi:hypothetical protein